MKPKSSKQNGHGTQQTNPTLTAEGLIDEQGLPTGPTGRFLLSLRDTNQQSLMKSLKNTAGLTVATTADWENAEVTEQDLSKADGLILENLGIAVVEADPSQLEALENAVADNLNPVLAVEPEEYVCAVQDVHFAEPDVQTAPPGQLISPNGLQYLRGYHDAIGALIVGLAGGQPAFADEEEFDIEATYTDTGTLTWGLQATRAALTRCTGAGIRVAVLDTGFDLSHPDFAGRSPITASFVPGQSVQDGHGHGTHCIGTALGPKAPQGTQRRYGVAPEGTILAAKVLNDQGSGQDGWILAGINWAIQNKAAVVSMSLGGPVVPGQPHKVAYEQAALAALNAGCIIIAAAGNRGNQPVSSPANCPSIMAVGALDPSLQRATFSCVAQNPNGGEVNIAGPGVAVYSSTRQPQRYATFSGTSMATPHVAGCAALWAQITGLRGQRLWNKLMTTARQIPVPVQQAGAGLVQAPFGRIVQPPRQFPRPPYNFPRQ